MSFDTEFEINKSTRPSLFVKMKETLYHECHQFHSMTVKGPTQMKELSLWLRFHNGLFQID